MSFLKKIYRIHIVRNLVGAFFGAAIAMSLYGVYQVGAQTVAYLAPPRKATPTVITVDNAKVQRTVERARQLWSASKEKVH